MSPPPLPTSWSVTPPLSPHRDQPTGDIFVQHELAPEQHVHAAEPEAAILERRECGWVRNATRPGALPRLTSHMRLTTLQ